MPTSYQDQFFLIDPYNPPPVGTALDVQFLTIVDQNSNNRISRAGNDYIDGSDITEVYPGDTVTVVMKGQTVTITGTTFYLADGRQVFTPSDGTKLKDATFVSATYTTAQNSVPVSSLGPPCFAGGTLIATPGGEVPVERILPGDRVLTADRGVQRVRWVGARRVEGTGAFAPVRFAAGVLGNRRALTVSPQHRMVLSGWQAELYFGEDEVLVPAVALTGMAGVTRVEMRSVLYVHLLFDRHEIVFAEGCRSESFYPGPQILGSDAAVRAEVTALFPELARGDGPGRRRAGRDWRTARAVLRGHEARLLTRAA